MWLRQTLSVKPGGVAMSVLMFRSGFWKHCGSKVAVLIVGRAQPPSKSLSTRMPGFSKATRIARSSR
jgi:hypothetical protein